MSYGYDTDVYPYDPEEVERQCSEAAFIFRLVTGDESIELFVNHLNKYDYEISVERDDHPTDYFYNLDDVESFIREEYPDADWEQ